ncbi:MAG TPA: hypothetical protein VGM78_09640, partial [Ilumatobacteraceae bacterium]
MKDGGTVVGAALGALAVTLMTMRARRWIGARRVRSRLTRARRERRSLERIIVRASAAITRRRRRGPPSSMALAGVLDATARRCAAGESLGESFVAGLAASECAEHFDAIVHRLAAGARIAEALD